jgi:hypothetical protein
MLHTTLLILGFQIAVLSTNGQLTNKDSLIKQLTDFKIALSKADKERVSSFFNFPITDENLKNKIELGGKEIIQVKVFDKKTFLKYYSTIFSNDFVLCLKNIDLTQLKSKNSIETSFRNKTTGCKETIEITIEGEAIEFTIWTNGDETCEFSEFWRFKIKKNKVTFKSYAAAG